MSEERAVKSEERAVKSEERAVKSEERVVKRPRYESQRKNDFLRGRTRVFLGRAFDRWQETKDFHGLKSHADMATFLLNCTALSTHTPSSFKKASHKTSLPDLATDNVCVNIKHLLQLFQTCWQCRGKCEVNRQGDNMHFTVTQHCQTCNLLSTWTSQPIKENDKSVHQGEGNQEMTGLLVTRESFDSDTDTAASREEESLLTDEDVMLINIRPTEIEKPEKSAVLTEEVEEEEDDWESAYTEEEEEQGNDDKKRDPDWEMDEDPNFKMDVNPYLEEEDGRPKKIVKRKQTTPETEPKVKRGRGRPRKNRENEDVTEKKKKRKRRRRKDSQGRGKETESANLEEGEDVGGFEVSEFDSEYDSNCDKSENMLTRKERSDVRKTLLEEGLNKDMSSYKRRYARFYKRSRQSMTTGVQKPTDTLCIHCGRLYKTLTHKCDPDRNIQCPDCGILLKSELNLSVHRNGYCRSQHESCVFCLKRFKTREDRYSHELLSHPSAAEKPYECPQCPLTFADRTARGLHLKEHPEIFRCQTCQKVFRDFHKLSRHEMTHAGIKPFQCEVCDRTFAQASQRKSHMRIHTGEKPFKCQLCSKSFNHNVSLKNHIKINHQDNVTREEPWNAPPSSSDAAQQFYQIDPDYFPPEQY